MIKIDVQPIAFLLLIMMFVVPSWAQTNKDKAQALATIQAYFNENKSELSYNYSIAVASTNAKSSTSLLGFLQKRGKEFYDSCQAYILIKNKDYVMQVNQESKTFSIVSFSKYKALTGMDPLAENTGIVVDIPIEVLDSASNFKRQLVNGTEIVEFQFHKEVYGFKYVKFKLEGKQVLDIEMSMKREGDELVTVKLYNIKRNIRDPKLFDNSRFYKINNGKVIYSSNYKKFQHNEVI